MTFGQVLQYVHLRYLLPRALQQTKKGDILVLAGKGHESYQLIQNKKIPFSEKEIIQKAIQSNLMLFS